MAEGALSPLKVLEATSSVAGAYCGKLLAGCGADVLKIEKPGAGDPARAYGPFPGDTPHPEKSGLFLHLNTGKRSITLDVETATGAGIFKDLVEHVDVLLEDFRPGTLDGLGLTYDVMAGINPRLIMTSVTPFGQTGPYRDLRTTELTTFALSGYMDLTGLPEREPLKTWGFVGEYMGGVCAALGTMSGLSARELTGAGQRVDASVFESMMILLGMPPVEYRFLDQVFKRAGNGTPGVDASRSMSHLLPARNGHIQFHPAPPGMLNLLTGEPRLEEQGLRREEYDELFRPWLMKHDKEEIAAKAQDLRLAFTEVFNPGELLEDVQHEARGMFEEIDHPAAGSLKQPGPPFHMHETPWSTRRAPLLGEHNELVYSKELKYSHEELVRLKQRSII